MKVHGGVVIAGAAETAVAGPEMLATAVGRATTVAMVEDSGIMMVMEPMVMIATGVRHQTAAARAMAEISRSPAGAAVPVTSDHPGASSRGLRDPYNTDLEGGLGLTMEGMGAADVVLLPAVNSHAATHRLGVTRLPQRLM